MMEAQTANAAPPGVLYELGLSLESTPNLPPEARDALLSFVQMWGSAEELLELVNALREVHGPMLFLLDYQAEALVRLKRYDEALEVIERRQRRSTSLATQAREAFVLLAAGQEKFAHKSALELSRSHPRQSMAAAAAAEILMAVGDTDTAESILNTFLEYRPRDYLATLVSIHLRVQTGDRTEADAQLQRLGAGISGDMREEELRRLQVLAAELGRQQTAAAAHLELERRRVQQLEQLHRSLRPFVAEESVLASDPEQFYRLHSGADSVPVSREERRRIELEVLRHFNFSNLRSGQVETMAAVLRGESILTVMPTGAGKSLCYQLPALVLPHATLVISPLIALMKDQVEGLPLAAQRQATFVNSSLSDSVLAERLQAIAAGKYKLIYVAPERLRQRSFLAALKQAQVDLFVVDEAHCVSMWGHDFRPDYLFIEEARHELGDPPALAMTATAPPRVRDEIVEYISNEEISGSSPVPERPRVISLDVFRSNLHLSAFQFRNEDDKQAALLEFIGKVEGSGVVYVNQRSKADNLALVLRNAGIRAEAYHAGLAAPMRSEVQDRFMAGTTRVIVATIAFGMGIDKSDIRFIVHFHPSRSLDSYYQEVGRAGRDGQLSQGVLFYSSNDWASLRRWANSDEYSVELLEKVYAAIQAQLVGEQPPGEDMANRRLAGPIDSRRLQQVVKSDGGNVDETAVRVAICVLERASLLERAFDLSRELEISVPQQVPAAAREQKQVQRLFKGLALQAGQTAAFASEDIARFMRWEPYDVESHLLKWQAAGWLTVRGVRRSMFVELPPRPADAQQRLERLLAHAQAVAQRRIEDVIGYATSETCRHGYISAHFGSPPRMRCTVCDNCTGVRPDIVVPEIVIHLAPDEVDLDAMILDCLLSLPRPVGRSGLARILTGALRAPFGPDKARHFGALKELGEAVVSGHIDQLLKAERLRAYESRGYPVLAATMRGRAEADAWLLEHPDLNVLGEPLPVEDDAGHSGPAEGDKYTALQKALWLWRRRMAEELGQPVYVVMTNEVMLRVAEMRPQTMEELAAIPGMGGQRLQHYGAAVLDIVKLHPANSGDQDLLAAQRQVLAEAAEGSKAAASKLRQSAAVHSPQLERKLLMRLQEIRQKRAVLERSKPYSIAADALLRAIAQRAPESADELFAIPGFRSSGLADESVVRQILEMIAALQVGSDSSH